MERYGFTIGKGFADEIILTNGKKYYTGTGSMNSQYAKSLGLTLKSVRFEGCCIAENIMNRAKDEYHFPIKIDDVDIYDYIDMVATDDESII